MTTKEINEVAEWIEGLGYPQYKDCFVSNFIDWDKLKIINSATLPQLGIQKFNHIQDITKHIRERFDLQQPDAKRSIAEVPYTTH
eukprot:m.24358 g.24358  ORF g.24358 m.24358 type:complete len:85 (+) comp5640_c0_seq1:98-352(+)